MAARVAAGSGTFAGGLTVLAGLWLLLAPYVLNYDGAAGWNDGIFGVVLVGLGLLRVVGPAVVGNARAAWLNWLTAVVGLWVIVAPFILADAESATRWNGVIVGGVVALLGLWGARTGRVGAS